MTHRPERADHSEVKKDPKIIPRTTPYLGWTSFKRADGAFRRFLDDVLWTLNGFPPVVWIVDWFPDGPQFSFTSALNRLYGACFKVSKLSMFYDGLGYVYQKTAAPKEQPKEKPKHPKHFHFQGLGQTSFGSERPKAGYFATAGNIAQEASHRDCHQSAMPRAATQLPQKVCPQGAMRIFFCVLLQCLQTSVVDAPPRTVVVPKHWAFSGTSPGILWERASLGKWKVNPRVYVSSSSPVPSASCLASDALPNGDVEWCRHKNVMSQRLHRLRSCFVSRLFALVCCSRKSTSAKQNILGFPLKEASVYKAMKGKESLTSHTKVRWPLGKAYS